MVVCLYMGANHCRFIKASHALTLSQFAPHSAKFHKIDRGMKDWFTTSSCRKTCHDERVGLDYLFCCVLLFFGRSPFPTSSVCKSKHLCYGCSLSRATMLHGIAVCCSVLQCVAVCCSVLQCDAVCCGVMQCDAVCCSVL